MEPLVYGERGNTTRFGGLGGWPPVGSRGFAPGGSQRAGAKPPEANEILTYQIHILFETCNEFGII